ncbi:MAG: RagB/SusD family nutrient uptake outer membrane protein [Sphingobacteriales bacterium]|nr:RagB/SusD family nutrient uptake outer membrane protein [Sphingobacteriales bacterium]
MRTIIPALIMVLCLGTQSCTKEFLDKKPDKKMTVPTKLWEFQALLDNDDLTSAQPFWGEWGADNFYLEYANWQSLVANTMNAYIWSADILQEREDTDWTNPYGQVYIANVVLEGINNLDADDANKEQYNQIKGGALYFRANAFFNLVQIYSKTYVKNSADTELGIILRLNANLSESKGRSSLLASYDQILKDFQEALRILPLNNIDPVNRNRPSKASAYAMLARVYLNMGMYEDAEANADSSLRLNSELLDYNTLNPTTPTRPFPRNNPEILADCFVRTAITFNTNILVDTMLYNSYLSDDLRKTLYFKNNTASKKYFVGQYTGLTTLFGGVATDEMYLIRAECRARLNRVSDAMGDLNTLLEKRWRTGTFVDFAATDAEDALIKILEERRKELPFRGLRWTDLKRLNKEPQFSKTLSRILNNTVYELPPNDPRYVYQIPNSEVLLNGTEQNKRD